MKNILKIPEETICIPPDAYKGHPCTYIELPDSLQEIGDGTFAADGAL